MQSKRAEGNLRTETIKDHGLIFWTITLWRDQDAMRAFRNTGDHKTAMPKLAGWCDEATYVHWEQTDQVVPDMKTAYERLVSDGVVTKVKYPSSNNATRAFPAPINIAET